MKTNWIKLSTFFLGATLALSSCVKNEESAEVIELRKAAAAKLNADAAYRQAEVKYQNAIASIQQFAAKRDSARFLNDITLYEAQAQVNIQGAKNQLLDAQKQFEINTKALAVEALNNPVLTALIADYKAYYEGGTLTSGKVIADGIFGLQGKILTENGTIIGLQSTKNGLAYVQKGKEVELAAQKISLADQQALLKILGDARTSGNYDAAITAAQALLAASSIEFAKLELAFDNAKNLANAASTQLTTATSLYTGTNVLANSYKSDYKVIIATYDASSDEKIDYDAMILAQTNAVAEETRNQTVLTTMTTKYQAALTAKNTAQTNLNTALAAQAAAQAIVDAKTANGETPTTADNDAVTAANTAVGNAQTALTEKEGYYDDVAAEYASAKSAYDNSKDNADDIRADVAEYNRLKAAFTIEDSKLPALKADMDAKKEISYKLSQSRDSISILYNNAKAIKINDEAAVTLLKTDRTSINIAIDSKEVAINTLNEAIAKLTTDIANLQAGINTADGNKLVDAQIEISTGKIAEWEGLLSKYQAAAEALKVKIDAQ